MPLLKLETTISLSDQNRDLLLAALSKLVARTIGKPEQYVMVTISPTAILMAGKPGPACFVDIRSIGGLSGEVNEKLTRELCRTLNEVLGVSPERVYLNFTDVAAADWGWNGNTLG